MKYGCPEVPGILTSPSYLPLPTGASLWMLPTDPCALQAASQSSLGSQSWTSPILGHWIHVQSLSLTLMSCVVRASGPNCLCLCCFLICKVRDWRVCFLKQQWSLNLRMYQRPTESLLKHVLPGVLPHHHHCSVWFRRSGEEHKNLYF